VLWAYSPDARIDAPRERFWTWYPGDGYVDVIGVDDYSTLQAPNDPVGAMTAQLRWLASAAESRGKMAAITETGFETIPDSTWWTARLLAAIQRDSLARRIAYVLVWRNANRRLMGREHFYAPYSGHASAADFRRFRADPLIAFEDELPPLYRLPSDR
jgi:mannan endo-1,4-beta-mannosidase